MGLKDMNITIKLLPEHLFETVKILEKRIKDRFPDSSLGKVLNDFVAVTSQISKNIDWISKPSLFIRSITYLVVFFLLFFMFYWLMKFDFVLHEMSFERLLNISDLIFNNLVILAVIILFLLNFEQRVLRRKAITVLHELKVIAHVIDMHQLTKDPSLIGEYDKATQYSPTRNYTKFELERYLDYCSESISLIAKVAALYSQHIKNEAVHKSVSEIEMLCTGINRKIWQKIIILNN